jgi:hypothetical protein
MINIIKRSVSRWWYKGRNYRGDSRELQGSDLRESQLINNEIEVFVNIPDIPDEIIQFTDLTDLTTIEGLNQTGLYMNYKLCEFCFQFIHRELYLLHMMVCFRWCFDSRINSFWDIRNYISYLPVIEREECPICYDVINDYVCELDCGHGFCTNCIESWIINELQRTSQREESFVIPQCPVCRRDIC